MAKFYHELNEALMTFIGEQKIFFVATAPNKGRVNVSPKGLDTLRCLNEKRVAFLDLTGSGNESAAHLADNGRMTIMFCSFAKQPLILRLYGQGYSVHQRDTAWAELVALFGPHPGTRQIIVLDIDSVQTSCGFAVPRYEFQAEREALTRFAEQKGEDGLLAYRQKKNVTSIDGLPTGLFVDEETAVVEAQVGRAEEDLFSQRDQLFILLLEVQNQITTHLNSVLQDELWSPTPESWSFRDIAAHLATVEAECHLDRIQQILTGAEPHFETYLNEDRDFRAYSLSEALRAWATTRQKIITLVRVLSAEAYQLTGTHVSFGQLNVLGVLHEMYKHDREHLQELKQLMAL